MSGSGNGKDRLGSEGFGYYYFWRECRFINALGVKIILAPDEHKNKFTLGKLVQVTEEFALAASACGGSFLGLSEEALYLWKENLNQYICVIFLFREPMQVERFYGEAILRGLIAP